MKPAKNNQRVNWGRADPNLPSLNLAQTQKKSYDKFLNEGIQLSLSEVGTIYDFTEEQYSLDFGDHYFGELEYTPEECLQKNLTYDAPLYIETTLTDLETSQTKKQEVFLGDIPQMTPRGTFIINGVERVI